MSIKFDSYISKIEKQVHPDLILSIGARSKLNDFVNVFVKDFVKYLIIFTDHAKKKTIAPREVNSTVRTLIRGELAKHAVSAGTKAVTKYTLFSPHSKENRTTDAVKAGLVIPPIRIRTIIKDNVDDYKLNTRLSETTSVYLAAVVEYLLMEILELSGNIAKKEGKNKIIFEYIEKAIQNDKELKKTFYCSLDNHPFQSTLTTGSQN